MTQSNNWIESPCDNDWDALLAKHDTDRITFFTDTVLYLLNSDKPWDKIPVIIDSCPHKQLIICLAAAYVLVTTNRYDKKYYGYLMNMLTDSTNCSNLDNLSAYLRSILVNWMQTDPKSSLVELFDLFFSFDVIQSSDDLYKGSINALYIVYPQEVETYIRSEKGQSFLKGIKRLQSVGFLSNQRVDVIEDLVIRQMGLPPIEFEPVDLESVFKRCGWKSYEDDPIEENTNKTSKIVDVLEIGNMCYLTDPCRHDVVILLESGDKKTKTMTINEIQELYSSLGKEMPQIH
jgi:hypothetical protein